jgi:hypothetical protein
MERKSLPWFPLGSMSPIAFAFARRLAWDTVDMSGLQEEVTRLREGAIIMEAARAEAIRVVTASA